MKIGSLFDGIGGWPLAAVKCGFTPVWSSEIENFPSQVTERHFPNMVQLGDITKIDGTKIEAVDIITFGSPCQDLSIAGKRGGLEGARSGLFNEAVRIIREMRLSSGGKYPRFAIWENVPGAFSSNKGMDFRIVLEEITETKIPMPRSKRWATAGMVRSNKCEVAWRVLDSQYWGVPQRRKRIFLVADFGGRCAGEILFKPESVSRYFAEGSGEREGIATNVENSTGNTSRGIDLSTQKVVIGFDTNASIKNSNPVIDEKTPPIRTTNKIGIVIYDMTHAEEVIREVKGNIVPTLNARMGTGGNQVPLILRVAGFKPRNSAKAYGIGYMEEESPTLSTAKNEAIVILACPVPINDKATRYQGGGKDRNNDGGGNGLGIGKAGDPMPTLTANDRHAVAYPSISFSQYVDDKVACTLRASGGNLGGGSENLVVYGIGNGQADQIKLHKKIGTLSCMHDQQAIIVNYKVRRLTPLECERLQGLQDGWTDNGSDTARYKALGNGMAQPCPDYVMQGIAELGRP